MPAAIRLPALSRLMLACATVFGAASAAQAQSLAELYEAARGYDAAYLAARAQAESVQYRADQARGLRLPRVDLTAGASRSEVDPPAGDDRLTKTTQVGVNGRQPLFNRSNSLTIEKAERAVEVARADLQTAEQDLIVRVAQSYFDVLAAQDALATAQANKKGISEQLASAKRNFEVGTATITDTREAQARFDLATAQEIAAENDLRTKRIQLDQLVGRAGVTPRPLTVPVALPAVTPANVEEWVSQTEDAPNVRKARLGYDIARLDTDLARAGHLPTVDLVASAGRSHNSGNGATLQGINGNVSNNTVGVQLNLPLFAGFQTQNRVKETLALEEQSRNNLEAARRSVAQATRQVFFGVQSGQAQVQALEAAEASSKLALEATQLGYRVGVRVNLDVLNAQTQLFTTQRDLAKARYDVVVNGLRLRQAAGTLNPGDVNAVNQLIAR